MGNMICDLNDKMGLRGKGIPDTENFKCKGPGAGIGLLT